MASALRKIAPTPEERKAAMAILSAAEKGGGKQAVALAKKCANVGMKHFVNTLNDVSQEDKEIALTSRGDEREQFNVLYLVRQAREKNAKNKVVSYTATQNRKREKSSSGARR